MGGIHAAGAQLAHQPVGQVDIAEDLHQATRRTASPTITAWILGHGLTLLVSPTNVVIMGGLAIAGLGYDKYLRFIWPLWLALFVVAAAVLAIAARVA